MSKEAVIERLVATGLVADESVSEGPVGNGSVTQRELFKEPTGEEPPLAEALGALAQRYVVLKDEARVVDIHGPATRSFTYAGFKKLYSTPKYRHGRSKKGLGAIFLAEPGDWHCRRGLYAPELPAGEVMLDQGERYWNTHRAHQVQPEPGDVGPLIRWLKDNVARGNQAMYESLIIWLAHLVQMPSVQPGVGLWIRFSLNGWFLAHEVLGRLADKNRVSIARDVTALSKPEHASSVLGILAKKPDESTRELLSGGPRRIAQRGQHDRRITNALRLVVVGEHATRMSRDHNKYFLSLETMFYNSVAWDLARWLDDGGTAAMLYELSQFPDLARWVDNRGRLRMEGGLLVKQS